MRTFFLSTCMVMVSSVGCWAQELVLAPQFSDNVPNVIITDRDPSGAYDAPNGAWAGSERAGSAFLFRYDNAFDLLSVLDLGGVEDAAQVRVAFTEYDNTDEVTPNDAKTLMINGKVALDKAPFVLNDLTHLAGGGWKIGESLSVETSSLPKSEKIKLGSQKQGLQRGVFPSDKQ
jgi:hypothetical protein